MNIVPIVFAFDSNLLYPAHICISSLLMSAKSDTFYDIYILQKLYGEQLQKQVLWTALVATAKKRGTLDLIEAEDIREIFDEIEISSVMENLWKEYQKNYYYAANISWQMVMQSIRFLYEISYNDNERTIIHE